MGKFIEKHEKLFKFLLIIGIACVIVPILIACNYTYLCEDDFSFEGGAKDLVRDYGSSLVGAAVRTREYYNTNQGTYLFTYLVSFIRAYSRWGNPGFHVFMTLNALLFMIMLYKLIKAVVSDELASYGVFLAATTMIFAMGNTDCGKELFFWYTGGLNFTLEYWLSFATAACLIAYMRMEKGIKKNLVLALSCFTAILASGGSLNLTSFNCSVILAVLIFSFDKVKKNVLTALPFVFALIGAIINVVAPGNFVRSEDGLKEGHSTLADGIRDTFTCCLSEDKVLFTSKVFLIMLAFVFAVCVIRKVKVKRNGEMSHVWLIVSLLGTAVVRFFTMFPIAYGYHEGTMVNMRTTCAYEITAKLMYILFVMCLAQWVCEHFEKKANLVSYVALAACVLVALIGYPSVKAELKEGLSYLAYWDIRSGDMKDAYATREYLLSSMELAPEGSDLVITVPLKGAESMYGMGLVDDPGDFRNISAAGLFDLNSVSVVYTD
ncbi:DUF6056 family protein [Butyrivibrio sp. INlla21]|uniref:DUF6056 family protein n=1 Tax=Butyrivibrio sp. INlla21 TaxID=1520811 RepID=UPI0008EFB6DE|nr:DUF6056 family protein [Butyrivibrio sp. INlla21]SFU87910.1 hypothetical protein SAMN02910342_02183 [Butyrivibrio sp. INlla21]